MTSNVRYSIANVLNLCERHFFARPITVNSIVDRYKFGPAGDLLKNNIHNEWVYSNVTNSEHNVFPYWGTSSSTNTVSDLQEAYAYVKHLSSDKLPFGIADSWLDATSNALDETTSSFSPQRQTVLRTTLFAAPSSSLQCFDNSQRHRKIWWRKFAASPGRFSLSDVQTRGGKQTVQITAEFPWGSQLVETITHTDSTLFNSCDPSTREIFQAREAAKRVLPHVVETATSLEQAAMVFLCDAYEEDEFQGQPRLVMNFHRKLAPYKTAFAATAASATASEELSQLSTYLSKQLRKSGISTLVLSDVAKRSVESQVVRNDEMGIPYTVVLNEATLKNGIVGLRSRNTTLKEQVHVTELKNYMELLLKNY